MKFLLQSLVVVCLHLTVTQGVAAAITSSTSSTVSSITPAPAPASHDNNHTQTVGEQELSPTTIS